MHVKNLSYSSLTVIRCVSAHLPSFYFHRNRQCVCAKLILVIRILLTCHYAVSHYSSWCTNHFTQPNVVYFNVDNFCFSSHSLKRRHSNESDSSIRRAKMARLDAEADQFPYRSSLTLSNISFLYEPLILCFKYLTVKELLRVSMSCKYLNRVASDSALVSYYGFIVKVNSYYHTDGAGTMNNHLHNIISFYASFSLLVMVESRCSAENFSHNL